MHWVFAGERDGFADPEAMKEGKEVGTVYNNNTT